jgi:hypothetical protein
VLGTRHILAPGQTLIVRFQALDLATRCSQARPADYAGYMYRQAMIVTMRKNCSPQKLCLGGTRALTLYVPPKGVRENIEIRFQEK